MTAGERAPRSVAATFAAAGAALCLLALLYGTWSIGLLDPAPPLLDSTVEGIRQSRRVVAGLGVGLLAVAGILFRSAALRHRVAGPRATRVTLSVVCLVIPLAVAEITLRPFIVPKTTIFVSDDELGWRLLPHASDRWLGVPVTINGKGLRGPAVAYERTPGTLRMLYLGDSVTFGAFLPDHAQAFAYEAGRILQRSSDAEIETVNAGVGGYSPWQQRLWLETEGVRYEPDLVVVSFVLNDVLEEAVLSDADWLAHRWQMHRTARTVWDRLANRSGLIHAATVAGRRLRWGDASRVPAPQTSLTIRSLFDEPDRPDVVRAWDTTLDSLGRIFASCRERTLPAVLVMIPTRSQVVATGGVDAPQRTLRDFAERRAIPFLDLLPELARAEDPASSFEDDVHLSRTGHARVGELLADWLRRAGHVSSPSSTRSPKTL